MQRLGFDLFELLADLEGFPLAWQPAPRYWPFIRRTSSVSFGRISYRSPTIP
jgi:hypothetical protein